MPDCVSPVYLVVDEFSPCVLWSLMIGLMVVLLTFFSQDEYVDAILGNGYGI